MGCLQPNQLEWTDSLTRMNRPDSPFQFSLIRLYRSFSLTRLPFADSLFTLAEWWRGISLGNTIPIKNMKCSSAERNLVVMLCVDWWLFAQSFENETGAESYWEPCIPWFTATGNATVRTNKQTIRNDSSWRTDQRELNQGNQSWNPSLVLLTSSVSSVEL